MDFEILLPLSVTLHHFEGLDLKKVSNLSKYRRFLMCLAELVS